MKAAERWKLYHAYMNNARWNNAMGNDVACYLDLLLANEVTWTAERTEKQKTQQKLWQQRGLLERTLANIRTIRTDRLCPYPGQVNTLIAASNVLVDLISANIRKMKNL